MGIFCGGGWGWGGGAFTKTNPQKSENKLSSSEPIGYFIDCVCQYNIHVTSIVIYIYPGPPMRRGEDIVIGSVRLSVCAHNFNIHTGCIQSWKSHGIPFFQAWKSNGN